ncbi:helix-turn-helix transcriptional regulator [Olsenella uli]|uniref:helix-turn-helix domain-containing protein n=1 Tax=Olsenella uli TaxID=133926 RepID=UPI00195C6661|nr:helix-turn-helix transcriptional regulator [Olsenella uli]
MKTLNEYVEQQLENPEFAAAWREGEGEYQAMRALVLARAEAGLSQREPSDRAGVPQKTISLIETADTNTTVRTLSKLAKGMGKVLRISFEDRGQDADEVLEE